MEHEIKMITTDAGKYVQVPRLVAVCPVCNSTLEVHVDSLFDGAIPGVENVTVNCIEYGYRWERYISSDSDEAPSDHNKLDAEWLAVQSEIGDWLRDFVRIRGREVLHECA